MYQFKCRFTEDEDEFFAEAKKLDNDYKVEKGADCGFDVIDIKTNNLDGLIKFVNNWYDFCNDYTDILEKYGIKKIA